MKTAVDEVLKWVKDELQLFGSAKQILIDKLNQAKEMEKEQIIKAYLNVHSENEYRWMEDDLGKELALQYYNETFKSE